MRGANEPRVPSRANLWRKCSNSHTTPCSRRLPPSFPSSTSPRHRFCRRRSHCRAKCHRFRPLLNRESRGGGRGGEGGKKTHTTAARLSAIRSVIIRNCSEVIDGLDRAFWEIHRRRLVPRYLIFFTRIRGWKRNVEFGEFGIMDILIRFESICNVNFFLEF